MEKDKKLKRIKKLHKLFVAGKIPTLAQHEVHPDLALGSRENYLYFTLPPCINFQRNSPAMWRAALATWEDSKTRYLFFPEKVIKQSREKIQADLVKHKLALQKNKHTDIWIAICQTLHRLYKNNPYHILEAGSFDAAKVLYLVQKEQKPHFTHLSGPKMANYWLYILSQYTDMKLANMQEISIIPDTHVLQCSIKLGISNEAMGAVEVAQKWKNLLGKGSLTPLQMHPVLWNWSRNNFIPEV